MIRINFIRRFEEEKTPNGLSSKRKSSKEDFLIAFPCKRCEPPTTLVSYVGGRALSFELDGPTRYAQDTLPNLEPSSCVLFFGVIETASVVRPC
jgi:hypothetical protein